MEVLNADGQIENNVVVILKVLFFKFPCTPIGKLSFLNFPFSHSLKYTLAWRILCERPYVF